MDKLTEEQIESRLEHFSEWSISGDALQRTFGFENFVSAMAFVNRVAELAEQQQHHPDIMVRYNKVTLSLSTHDAGGLTDRDFAFATEADSLVAAT